MSINRAYITSLSTTAILVASSVLVLAVTSAIVAFDHWPRNAASAPVDRVTVGPSAVAAQPLVATIGAAGLTAARAGVVAVRARPAPAAPSPRGGSPPTAPGEGPAPSAPSPAPTPAVPAPGARAASPPSQAPPPQPHDSPRPGDPIRATGDRLDNAIAPVNPAAGHTVAQVSGAAADAVDEAAGSPPAAAGG